VLSDKNVRKALAHAVDYDGIIGNITLGMAERTIGPFHPDVEYYNHDLTPVPFDLDKARALLAASGWKDSNDNGILDKIIEGALHEISLDITVSPRPEGQTVALLIKEQAAKIGIELNIITKDGAALMQDARNRNFEILPLRTRSEISFVDPYQTWHSSSDAPGGSNRCGFRNEMADSIITVIRTTGSNSERIKAYQELQAVLAEEQPVIFLYVPLERLIVSKKFRMQASARRPGYFENMFERVDT
jgi:peptide/nickel transport system substrate-binding protein